MLTAAGRMAACSALLVGTWLGAAIPAGAAPPPVVRIESQPGGGAPSFGGMTLAAGDTVRAFCAAYDSLGAYLGPLGVDWSVAPNLATLDPVHGESVLLRATSQGVFRLHALDPATGATATSDACTVQPGAPARLEAFASTSGGAPLAALAVSADSTLALYARGFDAFGNPTGAITVAWSVDAPLATVLPAQGSLTVLDARRTGTTTLRLATAGLPVRALPLAVSPGRLAALRIASTPQGSAVGDTLLAAGQTLALHAVGFDADGNALAAAPSVGWSTSTTAIRLAPLTGPSTLVTAQTPGTARVTARSGALAATSGTITVAAAGLARLRISTSPSAVLPLPGSSIDADQSFDLFAHGEDAFGNALGVVHATWTSSDALVLRLSGGSTSIRVDAGRTGSARIRALHASGATDSTAVLTVVPGQPARVRIETRPDGSGIEIGSVDLSCDSTLALHAVRRDADGNPLGGAPTTLWSLAGNVGSLSAALGSSVVLQADRPGKARVTAVDFLFTDATGWITTTPGAPHHVQIENASGTPLLAQTLRPGDVLDARAGLRDADDNRLGDVAVSWRWLGDVLAPLPVGPVSRYEWTASKSGRGRMVAESAGVQPDSSADITVVTGALVRIEIRDPQGIAVGARTLACDSTLELHAAGFDLGGNALGDVPVTWTLEGPPNVAALAPIWGTSTVLHPVHPATVVVRANHVLGTVARSGAITLVPGTPVRIALENAPDGSGQPVGAATFAAGATRALYALARDGEGNAVGPVPVGWSVAGNIGRVEPSLGTTTTFVAERTGTGWVAIAAAPYAGDRSGDFRVEPGVPAALVVETAGSVPFASPTLASGDSVVAVAVTRDAYGNRIGPVAATWSVTGEPGVLALASTGPLASTWVHARRVGQADLQAAWTTLAATAGPVTVRAGGLRTFAIESAPDGTGVPIAARTLAAGETLPIFAVGRDAVGNVVGPVQAAWEVVNGIGRLDASLGDAVTLVAERPGIGFVRAQASGLGTVRSGDCTVVPGTPVLLVLERTPGDPHDPLAAVTISADDSLCAFAVARDAYGNPLAPPGAQFSLGGDAGAALLGAGALTGEIRLFPRHPGIVHLQAAWNGFGATSAPISCAPGAPVGIIPIVATPDTLRPAGAAIVAAGSIVDRFGNPVADGTRVDLSSTSGAFAFGDDLEPATPGTQRRTIDGRITAGYTAPAVAGTSIVEARSGAAHGQAAIVCLPSVQLAVLPASFTPARVRRGATIEARVAFRNDDGRSVQIGAGTMHFEDGNGTRCTAALAAPVTIAAGATLELRFAIATVPAAMAPGAYAPTIEITGQDSRGDGFANAFVLEASSVRVDAGPDVHVTARAPERLTRGQTVHFEVDVLNSGDVVATLDPFRSQLESPAAGFGTALDPATAWILAPGLPVRLRFLPAAWPAAAAPGEAPLVLVLHDTGSEPAWSKTVSVASVLVEAPASLVALPGTLAPEAVPLGAAPTLGLGVANHGGSSLHLDATTRLTLGTQSAALAGAVTVLADSSAALEFAPLVLDGLVPGRYPLQLAARGTQNGAPFAADIALEDSLVVFAPAALAILGVKPSQATVTRNQTAPWDVDVIVLNSGQAEYRIDLAELHVVLGGVDRTGTYTLIRQKPGAIPLAPAALDTVCFRVLRTGPDLGQATLEANLRATDLATGREVEVDTYSGGKGSVRVQAPSALAAGSLLLSQPLVVAGQTRAVEARLAIQNSGEAAVRFEPAALAAALASVPPVPVQLAGNPTAIVLDGGASAEVHWTLGPFDVPAGAMTLAAEVDGIETNRAWPTGVQANATLAVALPAAVSVVGVQAPARLTIGSATPWSVRFALLNTGGAPVRLQAPRLTIHAGSEDVAGAFQITSPTHLEDRADLDLAPGVPGVLSFEIDGTGDLPRTLAVGLLAPAIELASGRALAIAPEAPASITVEAPPVLQLADATLAPRTASRMQTITITIDAANTGGASVLLDRQRTTVRLVGTAAVAPLAVSTVLAAGTPRELRFEPLVADVPSGAYAIDLHLEGTTNEHPYAVDLRSQSTIEVQPAARLEIVSLRTTAELVTRGQTRPWSVCVAVRNHGAAARFESAALAFAVGAEDWTSRFEVHAPEGFASGNATLAPGATDSLCFDIVRTADGEGLAVIDAALHARDENSAELLQASTTGTTRGSVRIVAPALPVVVALVPSQPRVSAGQTGAWSVRCTVRNDGGTAWQPDWDAAAFELGVAQDDSIVPPPPHPDFLAPGASREATFQILRTGVETGELALRLALAGTQSTDGARIAAPLRTAAGPRAEQPASATLTAFAADLARPPHVNTGARLPLVLRLENRGEAALASCRVRLQATSATPADTLLETALGGGGVMDIALQLAAPLAAGDFAVVAAIESAMDANDPSHDDAIGAERTATLLLRTETPGALQVDVVAGQPRVSAGQPTPWWISVRVANAGMEPLRLAAPRAADLEFRRVGVPQLDYVVLPPDTLEEGGMTVGGGEQGTLRYRVARTGASGGDIEILARTSGAHANDPLAAASAAEGRATVVVDAEAGLRLFSTDAWTVRRQHGHDDYRMHTGQPFTIRVVVENLGGTWLDSVLVRVDSQRGNSHVEPGTLAELAPGERGTLDLPAVAGTWLSQPGLPETFAAYIALARDRNSGLPVLPAAPIDNATLAYVEMPARLAVGALIESPEGARDGALSAGQTFVLAATVVNEGQADVSASGRLALELPAGYALTDGEPERFFVPGESVRFTIRAPETPSIEPQEIAVRIAAVPLDLDDGEPADVAVDEAAIAVHVRAPESLHAELAIGGPAGATDGVVSTGQAFELEIAVRGDPDLAEREATLALPLGWRDLGGTGKRDLPSDPEVRFAWPIAAGETPGTLPLVLRLAARDRNDDSPHIASDTLFVRVERAARLAVAAAITSPVEATTGRLLPGQRFVLRARVRNQGEAPVEGGTLRLVDLPPGYAANIADRGLWFDTTGAATAEWEVTSPATARPGVETLRVAFAALPQDGNTGAAATLDPDSTYARVAVSLADDAVSLDAMPLAARLAAPGERRVPLLRLEIANQGGADVQLDSLGVQQVDRGAPAAQALVAALHLVREDAPEETLTTVVHAAPIAWLTVPPVAAARLRAGTSARWVLLADLAAGADSPALGLALRATPNGAPLVRVSQTGSRWPVPVRAASSATLASHPLRVVGTALQAFNAPNPFHAGRERTTIRYQVDASADVEVRIATLRGELVWETRRREETTGPALRAIEWDGRNGAGQMVRNGVYVCHVQAGSRSSRFKIAVVR